MLRKSNLAKMTEINRSKYKCEHPEVIEEVIATGRTYDITEMYSEITHGLQRGDGPGAHRREDGEGRPRRAQAEG